MSKIDELIAEFCPEGVPVLAFGGLVINRDNERRPVTRDLRLSGTYPYYGANGVQDYVEEFIFDGTFLLVGEDGSVIEADGAPVLNWAEGKIWVNNHAHVLAEKPDGPSLRYLYFYLSTINVSGFVTGGTQKKINQGNLNKIPIPIPPLEVQRKIVSILDKFTQLEAELEAELEARRSQYEHTREQLLNFSGDLSAHPMSELIAELCPEGVEYKTLGELLEMIPRGKRLTKSELPQGGSIPVFHGGLEPIGFTDQANTPAMTVMVINVGASAGNIGWSEEPFWCSDGCFALPHSNLILPKYLYYCSSANQRFFVDKVRKAGIPTLAPASVLALGIPVPPLQIQSEIVSILDKLDALVNDLTFGLPAEIAARRKQYEHYRNKLLTFKELESA
jgi:type I restriction enzyme S subunit